MTNTANLVTAEAALDLSNIRASLRRQEDSIVFSLIERAQYRLNQYIYEPDCSGLDEFKRHQLHSAGSNACLADYLLYQTECIHAQARRYTHPTETSFFSPLPSSVLPTVPQETILAPHNVNINSKLLELYRTSILPEICEDGDDTNHGSAAVQDVHTLQTIATRVYFGLFVAESKFRSNREAFSEMIRARDSEGLMAAITKPEVEASNIRRVVLKAATFSQDIDAPGSAVTSPTSAAPRAEGKPAKYKVPPEFVGRVFKDYIMPLTKEVEVDYLLQRLEHEEQP